MKQWFDDFKAAAKTKYAQFNNRTYKEALMAASAYISSADGDVSAPERKKVLSLIANNEALQVFDAAELGSIFNGYCDKGLNEFGRMDLLKPIRKFKGNVDAADVILKTVLVIANSDGNFDESEKAATRELCQALGQPAADYVD
jgi:tellurite resistance protein TerB